MKCILKHRTSLIYFKGDRLTDERIQGAQKAMQNAANQKEKLEDFISKMEDFHRLMNFLEVYSYLYLMLLVRLYFTIVHHQQLPIKVA